MLLKWTIFSQVLDVTKEKRGKYLALILLKLFVHVWKLRDAACSYNNLSVTTEPHDSELFNLAALKNTLAHHSYPSLWNCAITFLSVICEHAWQVQSSPHIFLYYTILQVFLWFIVYILFINGICTMLLQNPSLTFYSFCFFHCWYIYI